MVAEKRIRENVYEEELEKSKGKMSEVNDCIYFLTRKDN